MQDLNIIQTERLIIKKLTLSDSEALFSYRSLPEICQYQSFNPHDLKDASDFIKKVAEFPNLPDTWYQVGVFLKTNNQLIGDIGIHFLPCGEQVEIGYTLDPKHQGQGYAYEAIKAIIDYLFNNLNKHRITASVDPNNLRSINLLNKLKFRKEAHFVKSFQAKSEWQDDCIYAILKEEWNKYLVDL